MINKIFNKNNLNSFLNSIFTNLKSDNIDVSNYELDHICYRVSTNEKYELLKEELSNKWELLLETLISWRNIATFKLNEPLIYKNREISIIEIPAPKIWSDYDDWFEHVEFVIDDTFDDFKKKYSNIIFWEKAINKDINPDIKVQYDGISVKFHHNTLEYVVTELE